MRIVNLPTELLRSFVTVIEVESFTRAAEILGRSQPAISLQIKRLEELVGYKLIRHRGRTMAVSDKGEALAMHARQILRLNDLAIGLFEAGKGEGALRVGLPLDYGVRRLQTSLTGLMQENPDMQMVIECDLSQNLHEALLRDDLDMIVALYQGGDPQFLVRHWQEQPVWVGADGLQPDPARDLPLIAHPAGCVYRQRMTEALKRVRRGWQVVLSSPDIAAVQQAVRDGLGISCLTNSTIQPGMRRFATEDGLPDLESLRIGLFYRQTRLSAAGNLVAETMTQVIEGFLEPEQTADTF